MAMATYKKFLEEIQMTNTHENIQKRHIKEMQIKIKYCFPL